VSLLGKLGLFARAALAGIMTDVSSGNFTNLDEMAMQSLAVARGLLLEHGVSA
jgi:hypothetical protein